MLMPLYYTFIRIWILKEKTPSLSNVSLFQCVSNAIQKREDDEVQEKQINKQWNSPISLCKQQT